MVDVDPPYRTDPFQNIIAVSWTEHSEGAFVQLIPGLTGSGAGPTYRFAALYVFNFGALPDFYTVSTPPAPSPYSGEFGSSEGVPPAPGNDLHASVSVDTSGLAVTAHWFSDTFDYGSYTYDFSSTTLTKKDTSGVVFGVESLQAGLSPVGNHIIVNVFLRFTENTTF